jgi:hypothetical protein
MRVVCPCRRPVLITGILVALASAVCGGGVPSAPDAAAPGPDVHAALDSRAAEPPGPNTSSSPVKLTQTSETVAFENGTFTLTTAAGDQISGTYAGEESTLDPQPSETSLVLQVTTGSGIFAEATGTLAGSGTGEFTGDGEFSLSLKGKIATSDMNAFPVRATLQGTAQASCNSAGHIVVSFAGSGSMLRAGSVSVDLQHEVVGSGCSG